MRLARFGAVVTLLAVGCAACKKDDSTSSRGDKQPTALSANRGAADAAGAGVPGVAKHTLKQITAKLDQLKKQRDVEGLFEYASKRYRTQIEAQAKRMLDGLKPEAVRRVLGMSKAEAAKLSAKDLLKRLQQLPEMRKVAAEKPHLFVRADFETKSRASVLTVQDGVECRCRFVLEDGDWRVDQGAVCAEAKLTAADKKLFAALVGFMRLLVTSAEKHVADCNQVAAAWQVILGNAAQLVKQRRALLRQVPRYKLFSRIHQKENAALTRRLMPVLQKCAKNPAMRRVLSRLM